MDLFSTRATLVSWKLGGSDGVLPGELALSTTYNFCLYSRVAMRARRKASLRQTDLLLHMFSCTHVYMDLFGACATWRSAFSDVYSGVFLCCYKSLSEAEHAKVLHAPGR